MRSGLSFALLACALVLPSTTAGAQSAPAGGAVAVPVALNPAEAGKIIPELAAALEANYVDPEVGKLYSTALATNLAAGKYAGFTDPELFANVVTADLQTVHQDAHLRLFSPAKTEKMKGGPANSAGEQPASFIEKSGEIAPGIAYISFLAFMGDEPTLSQLRAFLSDHADVKVLIIDARHHHGGGLDEMDLLFSQLFDQPTDLLTLDTREAVAMREGGEFGDLPTLKLAAAPATVVRQVHRAVPATAPALAKAKVFLLTSRKTASAGEHLALALKRTHRATVIGETTRGAGNYGQHFELADGFAAFIPYGTTFDPDTGEGWEGVGVKPDIAVPADQALDEALKLAGVGLKSADALASLH